MLTVNGVAQKCHFLTIVLLHPPQAGKCHSQPGVNPLSIIPHVGFGAIQTSEIWTWIFGEKVSLCDAYKIDMDCDSMTVVEAIPG